MYYLDLVLEAKGDFREARADLEHILAITENGGAAGIVSPEQIFLILGWLDFDQGDYAAAEQRARARWNCAASWVTTKHSHLPFR
jgi:hypothetical protein